MARLLPRKPRPRKEMPGFYIQTYDGLNFTLPNQRASNLEQEIWKRGRSCSRNMSERIDSVFRAEKEMTQPVVRAFVLINK